MAAEDWSVVEAAFLAVAGVVEGVVCLLRLVEVVEEEAGEAA